MDYIYGKLNEKVTKVTYDGVVTSTTKTTTTTSLDENTIKVDVLKTPGTLTIVDKDGNNLSFNGSNNVQINLQQDDESLATKDYVDEAIANAGGVTEEQVNDLIATYMSSNYENGNTGSY